MGRIKRIIGAMLVGAVMASFVGCGGGGLFANAYLVRGEEVTADEWREAFDFSDVDNFSVYMTDESEDEDGAFQTETTYEFADGNVYVQAKAVARDEDGEEETEELEAYYIRSTEYNGLCYVYAYDSESGEWECYTEINGDSYNILNRLVKSWTSEFGDSYDEMEYSGYYKGYVYKKDDDEDDDIIDKSETVVKIADGRFIAMHKDELYENKKKETKETSRESLCIFDIGSTSITLPDDLKELTPQDR